MGVLENFIKSLLPSIMKRDLDAVEKGTRVFILAHMYPRKRCLGTIRKK